MNRARASALTLLKKSYRRASIFLFGNTIGIRVNLLYCVHGLCLVLWNRVLGRSPARKPGGQRDDEPADAHDVAATVRERGFVKIESAIGAVETARIADRVDDLFRDDTKIIATLEDGGLIRLKQPLVEVPELEGFLTAPVVKSALEDYFGSNFKVFSCDVYRTEPRDPVAAAEQVDSLKWHFDNCPSTLLKVMIYLTDTRVKTGAISLLPKPASAVLRRRGFWVRDDADEFLAEIESQAVQLEGAPGTTLLFSTHHCIHKATLPLTEHRGVAVFLLQPCFRAQGRFSPADRRTYSTNFGYCVNPFRWKPLRVGTE